MKIILNNREEIISDGLNIRDLLENKGIRSKAAVWVNGRQLLLSEYPKYYIQENDVIKILRVIGGG